MAKRLSTALLSLALVGSALTANAVSVKVDSTKNWLGYMNYLTTNAAWKPGGSAWAVADLRAGFTKTNANPSGWPVNDWAWIQPNTNTYDPNPTNNFWNNPDGSPGQTLLEQNFYVDVFTNFGGDTVTFTGTVGTNTLAVPTAPTNGHSAYAVVKEFGTTYANFIGVSTVPLVAGTPFSVSRPIGVGGICQYGFMVIGPNAGPGAGNPNTGVSIAVEDADPAILTQPAGVTTNAGKTVSLTVRAVGATSLSYQWQRFGTNVQNGGNISGATTTNLVISSATPADSGSYTVLVTDTAGSVTSAAANVTVFDILITGEPADLRLQVGDTATFTVAATSGSPISYLWRSIIGGVTNVLTGATNATLTLTNVQLTNAGTYQVTLTAGVGTALADAVLVVKTPADWVNFLENPGFENDPTGANETPWVRFESATGLPPGPTLGVLQSAADTYFGGDPVNVFEGTFVSFTTFAAEFTGIYQDVPAQPGQIFAADMRFYNAGGTGGDPLPGPDLFATNESYLEVQFRNAADQVIYQYISDLMDYTTPSNTWFNLQATNAGAYSQVGTPAPADATYLVAPAGTAKVRFQVTLHDIANSVPLGSLYYDNARLLLKLPATLKVAQVGGNTQISWDTLGATSYQVQYKDNLSDPNWTDLEVVPGTGSTVTRSYPSTGSGRLYRVLTL